MAAVRVFTFDLDHPGQLFAADPISPASPGYTAYTAQPALDTVRDELLMRAARRNDSVVLDLGLPADQLHPGLAEELTTAVRRWVRVQNALDGETTGADGSVGRRLFVLGVLAFLALQIGSYWVKAQADNADLYIVDAIGEGMSVASWVMLWFPVQMFTMEVWRARIRRRRMAAIERLRVEVRARA